MAHGLMARVRLAFASRLARNAAWMLVGQGLNLLFQAGYFITIARLLGAAQYGVYAGAYAFVCVLAPYSGMGSGLLFVRYVSADRGLCSRYFANLLLSYASFGLTIVALLGLVAPHLLNPFSAEIVLILALGEAVFRQVVIGTSQIFQAFERLKLTALVTLATSFLRLLAVATLAVCVRAATAKQWAWVSLGVSALAAAFALALVVMLYGRPRFSANIFRSRLREGIGFALAGSTQSVYNDVDKTLLSHYALNVQNGIYTMAYRLIDIATIPITAIDAAALPRYFVEAARNPSAVYRLAFRLAVRGLALGLGIALVLQLCAPLVPYVVGQDYGESVAAVRWLCFIPALRAVHQLCGSAMTGLGRQAWRTGAQLAAAVVNLGLNLWWIPTYGWLGAAWASLLADGLLALVNVVLLSSLQRRLADSAARA